MVFLLYFVDGIFAILHNYIALQTLIKFKPIGKKSASLRWEKERFALIGKKSASLEDRFT